MNHTILCSCVPIIASLSKKGSSLYVTFRRPVQSITDIRAMHIHFRTGSQVYLRELFHILLSQSSMEKPLPSLSMMALTLPCFKHTWAPFDTALSLQSFLMMNQAFPGKIGLWKIACLMKLHTFPLTIQHSHLRL